jgi:uncharacterized protein
MAEPRPPLAGEEYATELSQPYWDALRAGRLSLQSCRDCRRAQHYPRVLCRFCGSRSLAWADSGGRGEIFASTRTERVTKAWLRERTPFTLAVVALTEGPLIMTLVDEPDAHLPAGAAVRIDFALTLVNGLLTVVASGTER